MIKNKAHVNKQLTVEECKLIITRLQDEITLKDKRIMQLTVFIKTNGLDVPSADNIPTSTHESINRNEEDDDDVPLTQDELLVLEAEKQQLDKQREIKEQYKSQQNNDNENFNELLLDDDQKEKDFKNSQVSKHLEEKEKEIKLLKKQIEDMEINSRSTEDKFKNQLKI